jgi:hypothetical protein
MSNELVTEIRIAIINAERRTGRLKRPNGGAISDRAV